MGLGKNVIGMCAVLAGVVLLFLALPGAAGAAGKSKPMIPVQVDIKPTAAKMKPQNIKPGDVVEFKVSARAVRGSDEMTLEITLLDGAELVSGDLKWSGKVSGNEEKQLVISVRAPGTGTGRIMANVTILRNGKATIAKQAIYTLGSSAAGTSGKPAPAPKRDSKGRPIVEY